jgi:hypothetical protein
MAFFGGLGCHFEHISRRKEVALYVVPRFFECLWKMLFNRKMVINIPFAEVVIFAFLFGIMNYFYKHEVK